VIIALFAGLVPVSGQDFSVLRINEVISDNETQPPGNSAGDFRDMVEIYNSGNETLFLGDLARRDSLALSDTVEQPIDPWTFPRGFAASIPAKGFLVVYLGTPPQNSPTCELNTGFGLSRRGSEPLTLWGPEDVVGDRAPIDQVWLPPLDDDVSFGRHPDGAGPAPVSIEETLNTFHYYPAGTTTLGTCAAACSAEGPRCAGAPNGLPGANLAPRIKRLLDSTNRPAINEAVLITARVSDDKLPLPGNIMVVLLRYEVDGVETDLPMIFDANVGDNGILNAADEGRPLEIWSLWRAAIPGQPAGTRVRFTLHVEDEQGLVTADPFSPCADGVGPCNDLGLPGPGCVMEPAPGLQFLPCSVPFEYVAGLEPPPEFQGLVINEVVASQTNILENPARNLRFDDFIEIYNGGEAAVSLAGLWLSDKPFDPRGWQFPSEPESRILPGEYILVWLDNEGGKCPRPPEVPGDGQECPDPTSVPAKAYHTNFALNALGDQIHLFNRERPEAEGGGFGWIHGVEFGEQKLNVSLSLIPDGDRSGSYEETPGGSPGTENASVGVTFLRGDAGGDCVLDIGDPIYTLGFLFQAGDAPPCPDAADFDDDGVINLTDAINLLVFLFQGGTPPEPPGHEMPGVDPTGDDNLGPCEQIDC
jgi:hypothetical protein